MGNMISYLDQNIIFNWSQDSDLLRVGRSRDQILVGARFSAPVQTGCEAHPASCTVGTTSFPGVKQPGYGIDHPPPYSSEVKEGVKLYLYSPSVPSWPALGCTLRLPLPVICKVSQKENYGNLWVQYFMFIEVHVTSWHHSVIVPD